MDRLGNLLFVFNLFSLFVNHVELRPVANSSLEEQEGCNLEVRRAERVRRSIPEFDAVNPASLDRLDQESLPDQDDPVDHQQQDLSQFSLGDQFGNLFRSHKSVKALPKSNSRPLPGDSPLLIGREYNDALRSDEQYECYRQQNIDPPMSEEDPRGRKKWAKGQGPRAMPIMDVPQSRRESSSIDVAEGPEIRYVPYVRSEVIKESGKNAEQKNNTLEVSSMYSHPEHQFNRKIVKNVPERKVPSEYFALKYQKVPIPVNVHANFPIYDDDIDIDPDPLQGILDERYWFDPRENEPVMKMNIDEPIDERAPFSYVHHQKRRAIEKSGKKKQYNRCYKSSKEADISRKGIESCDECGKGKNAKKPNNTDSSDEGISYGRKLLSFNENNNNGNNEKHNFMDYDYEDGDEEQLKLDSQGLYRSRKLLSFEQNVYINDNDNMLKDNENDLKRGRSRNSRKLLWYNEYDEDEESYNDEGDDDEGIQESSELYNDLRISSELHSQDLNPKPLYDYNQPLLENSSAQVDLNEFQRQNMRYPMKLILNNEGGKEQFSNKKLNAAHFGNEKSKVDSNERNKFSHNTISKHQNDDTVLKETHLVRVKPLQKINKNEDSPAYQDIDKKKELGSFKVTEGIGENYMKAEKLIKGNVNSDLSKIYISNKIGDLLQKPQQEKPKGPRKNEQIDPNKEFEVMRNETFKNASMGFTTAPNKRVEGKSIHKRGNFNDNSKSRRSFSDDTDTKLNSHFLEDANLLQEPGVPGGKGRKEETTSSQTTTSASISPGKTVSVNPNNTTQSSNLTFSNATVAKSDDEEMDSKIANEIVETVIAETEKSSYNHYLGVCRRNESLMNIKFGRIVPETEKVIKFVTNCIMDKIKDHLARQSCLLLDEELLEFLKWMVLGGESYKEYEQKLGPKFFDFVPTTTENYPSCGPPTPNSCDFPAESLPPNPGIVQQALSVQQPAKESKSGLQNSLLINDVSE